MDQYAQELKLLQLPGKALDGRHNGIQRLNTFHRQFLPTDFQLSQTWET